VFLRKLNNAVLTVYTYDGMCDVQRDRKFITNEENLPILKQVFKTALPDIILKEQGEHNFSQYSRCLTRISSVHLLSAV
jgi:hypothetical protein